MNIKYEISLNNYSCESIISLIKDGIISIQEVIDSERIHKMFDSSELVTFIEKEQERGLDLKCNLMEETVIHQKT